MRHLVLTPLDGMPDAVELARAQGEALSMQRVKGCVDLWCYESNNLAIKGIAKCYERNNDGKTGHIIPVLTEHKTVLDACGIDETGEVTFWRWI